jgi:hypothetical protein
MNVQTIHGGSTGCSNCHPTPRSSFTTWNGTCNQGGCHNGVTSPSVHASVDASHVASAASNCTVAGCHSGGTNVALIHNVAKTPAKCLTCHNASTKASLTCTKSGCHGSGDSVNAATGAHANEASGHANYVDATCNSGCHGDCENCHDGNYASTSYTGDYAMGYDLPTYHSGSKTTDNIHYTNGCLTCHNPGTQSITSCQTCHDINVEMHPSWWPDMESW